MANQSEESLSREDRLEDVILAIEKAVDAGRGSQTQEYLDRFPELASELDHYMSTQEKLQHLLTPFRTPDPRSTSSWHEDAPPLPTIPGYEILGIIAQGGMGVVCKARHVEMDRLVALKLILPERLPDADSRQRFQTEARSIAQFDHPNIVRIWDYNSGEQDGCPRIVMEYVSGGNLAERSKQRPWPARKAAALVARIADAVDYAHRRGIIHRDLKCANVLLTHDGVPKIADFGLAKNLQPSDAFTTGPARIGSPAYMSPEQAIGDKQAIGPATDVFGLGAILYELLTGRPPLQGESTAEVLERAKQGIIASPREVNPQIPRALAKICQAALSADPKNRPPSAAALARELRRFANRPRRLAVLFGSAAAVLLVGVLAVAFANGMFTETDKQPSPSMSGKTLNQPKQPILQPQQLKGELIVRLYSPDGREKPGLSITQAGVLPARNNDRVVIEARLSEPAHALLIWLDTEGNPIPLYPWNFDEIVTEDLSGPLPHLTPKKEITSPTVDLNLAKSKGWPLDNNKGLETIVLLARREPLPSEFNLAQLIGPVPPSPLRDDREWGLLAMYRDSGNDLLSQGQFRGPQKKAAEIDDALLQALTRLREHFEVVQAVRFAHTKTD